MRNKILIAIIMVLSYFAVKVSIKEEIVPLEKKEEVKEIEVTILDSETSQKENLNLEDYIVGVVAAEMPASFSMEALKAQAVAARSYAMYKITTSKKDYDLVTDVTNQSYIDKKKMQEKWQDSFNTYYEKIKTAVEETKNQVLTYDDEVICAFYFAMSNGYTEDSALVFGEAKDYIASVDSSWDKNLKNYEVTTTMSKNDFCEKLNINCDNIVISDIKYSNTGRINSLKINNQEFLGTKVRTLLNLRSTDFKIEIGEDIKITTKGYGHGVGMSQYGANELAKLGKQYDEILKYYYKDVAISQINV